MMGVTMANVISPWTKLSGIPTLLIRSGCISFFSISVQSNLLSFGAGADLHVEEFNEQREGDGEVEVTFWNGTNLRPKQFEV